MGVGELGWAREFQDKSTNPVRGGGGQQKPSKPPFPGGLGPPGQFCSFRWRSVGQQEEGPLPQQCSGLYQ